MKKPIIGLTPNHTPATGEISIRPTFLNALNAVDAIPVVLPLYYSTPDLGQLVHALDGFVFTGGPDVHPFYLGEDTHPGCGNVSLTRDRMELALLSLIMQAGKPILGICRGLQLINIGLGGTIYQDLACRPHSGTAVAHNQPFAYDIPCHMVTAEPGTMLSKMAGHSEGCTLNVNSMHHQGIKTPAPNLTVSAYARDGLIEAVEKSDYPYLTGVQWHPEYLWQTDETALHIFQSFANACRMPLA